MLKIKRFYDKDNQLEVEPKDLEKQLKELGVEVDE